MIRIQPFVFNPFSENTYVVFDETREAVIIDPGCYQREEKNALAQFVTDQKLIIKYLLNTHCHIDHVLGNDFVKEKYNVPFLIHSLEEPVLKSVKVYAPAYGFALYREALPSQFIKEGETISFGTTQFEILFLPGHAPGHVGFYHKDSKSLLSGDVLFERSIGRTDLPGGNLPTLLNSIRTKIFALPDEAVVYSGHGNPTTVGEEKVSNPFCALSLLK